MSKNKKTKKSMWKSAGIYFTIFYALLNIAFVFQLCLVNVLPMKYLIPIVILMLLVLIGLSFLQIGKRISKVNRVLGKILIVLLSVILGFGNWYLFVTGSTFSKVTGDDSQMKSISVVVMKDNSTKKVEDLIGKKIGIMEIGDLETYKKGLKDFKTDIKNDMESEEFSSYRVIADKLYSGDVDAILIDESSRSLFKDNHENFDTETKVIKSYKYKTTIKDISKDVSVTTAPFNVYITGIDSYGEISTVARSDVNMIASVNPKTHQILLISIPRDYYVAQPCQNGQEDKLTHSGIFGVTCSVETVENFMNIDLNYYVRVNFSSLVDIVDALGGVTVDNPNDFSGNRYTYFPSGTIDLTGEQALEFARERYSFEGGDRERGKNQMRVITGIINKAISPAIITNYTSILNAISGSFQTNMSTQEMTSFIKMQLDDMQGWNITQVALNGTGTDDTWSPANGFPSYVMIPDINTVHEAVDLINKVHNGEDISGVVTD